MKKIIIFTLILAFFTIPVFSKDNNSRGVNFNVGNLGIGASFPFNNEHDFDFQFSLVNFGLDSKNSRFGILVSPFVFSGWSGIGIIEGDEMYDFNIEGISLINVNIYLNVLNGNNFYLGPFAAINYAFVDKEFYWDKYIFTAGIQMGMRLNFKGFKYNLFAVEAGYRNINGSGKYYLSGKIDLLTLFVSSLFGTMIAF